MSSKKPFLRKRTFFSFLALPLLLGANRPAAGPAGTAPPDLLAPYQQSAAALRSGDCNAALKALRPLAAQRGSQGSFGRLMSGFYAHTCGQPGLAEEQLFASQDPGGTLEDWRLLLLAENAGANGHRRLAQVTLARLLGDFPASPLRPRALVQAAELAAAEGETLRALGIVRRARQEGIAGAERSELEALAWKLGNRMADGAVRAEAARNLLVDFPARAGELQVIEIFRDQRDRSGELDWARILTPEQLQRRARALLSLKLVPSALQTLAAMPLLDRNAGWHLLQAEALTAAKRGREALEVLQARALHDLRGSQEAGLAWARAMAALDVASVQRGRDNLPPAERIAARRSAQQYLQQVVELGTDRELSARALRLQFSDLAGAEYFDPAVATLRKLQKIDPDDSTGANYLWNLGWAEYEKRNYTGAVGYWSELYGLYPRQSNGRRGRYWTGRAFEALGESERAQGIYAEIAAADTADFYRRSAALRLRRDLPAVAARASVEPWPVDPLLQRARLLSDLGLDQLAQSDLEVHGAKADAKAGAALRALILQRRGEVRKSVDVIRGAFPALGSTYQSSLSQEVLQLYYPVAFQESIRGWAKHNSLPPWLVCGIIRQESAFDRRAQSWAGARGLMQLMPGTARETAQRLGLSYSPDKLTEPDFNLQVGTTYFRQVMGMFDGNLELALAGYNGGPYRIKRLWNENRGGDLDRFLEGLGIEESKTYVKRILLLSDSYRQLYPGFGQTAS